MEKQGTIASKVQDFLVWTVFKYFWMPSSLVMVFGKQSYEDDYLWFSLVFLNFILLQTWDKLFFGNVDFGFLHSHSRLSLDPFTSKSRVYFKDYGSICGMNMCTTDDDEHGLSFRAIEGLMGNLARFCDFFWTGWSHCEGQFCWVILSLTQILWATSATVCFI
ncbi:hypothetical protein MA16_Dca002971 [Dendrobium catenatum]|uniref:Uncharacterized protein n=1 Tax=Dendrobium catenatum TaxID=906689 RepID=A0A2I0X958_9ASPA|nr:hypothetical protein MA16_Dca002971 [Dendrobium catenatum]